jgi:membrane associated rhomboid family serine protease
MISALCILLISIIASHFSIKNVLFTYSFNLWPNRKYEFWRPFTYSFIHLDKDHIIGNSVIYSIGFLGFFQKFDNWEFIKFYFLSAIFSVIPFILLNKNDIYKTLAGNSGVGFAILYGFIAIDPMASWGLSGYGWLALVFGTIFLLLSIYVSLKNKRTSLISHLSGLAFGVIYSMIFIK